MAAWGSPLPHALLRRRCVAAGDAPRRGGGRPGFSGCDRPQQRRSPARLRAGRRRPSDRPARTRGDDLRRALERMGHRPLWEFREPEARAVERTMRAAAESGAVVSINHPKPFGPPWEYAVFGGFHAVEVWNGPWPQLNKASLDHWDGLLRRGVRCAALGGSDTHYLHGRDVPPRHADSLGTPTTWVRAEASVPSILEALREG